MTHPHSNVGYVAIGRNEGERLKRCLTSLARQSGRVCYVDSGSIDDSVSFASSLGVQVTELSTDEPFTAARARNAGYRRLVSVAPQIAYVQFVDGDCELVAGYLAKAVAAFAGKGRLGVVSGRRRERDPDRHRRPA